jgi:hypothetical protein
MVKWRDFPVIRELLDEVRLTSFRESLEVLLQARFNRVPRTVIHAIRAIENEKEIRKLIRLSVTCPDLTAFRSHLKR